MTMTKALRTLLLLAVLAATAAAAEAPPVAIAIRDSAQVSGDVVRLCDVADLDADAPAALRQLVLGNAPWPGNAREISRVLVKARMVSAGLDLGSVRFSGPDVCLARASFLRIAPERIAAAAQDYVRSLYPDGGAQVSVALERQVAPVVVAAGEQPELRAVVSGTGAPAGSVRVEVEVSRDGVLLKRVPVSLTVHVSRTVGVASRMIAPGQALSPANVAFERRDVTDVDGAYVENARALAGRVADRPIAPGQVVTGRLAAAPQPPVVIRSNQRVFLVVQTPTLRVVTVGKAVGNARQGEVALARNLSTGREVVGTAAGPGIIEVQIGGPIDEG